MFIAIDSTIGKKVTIDQALQLQEHSYVCQGCRKPLILRNGEIRVPHFAHRSLDECDYIGSDMSEWHKKWQSIFPVANQEEIIEKDILLYDYIEAQQKWGFGEFNRNCNLGRYYDKREELVGSSEIVHLKHRTDVLACGYCIEFQHSPISVAEFGERSFFYSTAGYKVIWVFDMRAYIQSGQMDYVRTKITHQGLQDLYKWKNASKTFKYFAPQNHGKQVYDDGEFSDSEVILFFHLEDRYIDGKTVPIIGHVVWSKYDDMDGTADFSRFYISQRIPRNDNEFLEAVINRCL